MSAFKIGDIVKTKTPEQRAFKVYGFSKGSRTIPDGWLIDKDGFSVNPKHREQYKGALSVLPDDI